MAIEYELIVKGGYAAMVRPMLRAQVTGHAREGASNRNTNDFSQFSAYALVLADVEDGRVKLNEKLRASPSREEKRFDAFLGVSGVGLGEWSANQGLYIPSLSGRRPLYLAEFSDGATLELKARQGAPVGRVQFKDVIPYGPLQFVKARYETERWQKLVDGVPTWAQQQANIQERKSLLLDANAFLEAGECVEGAGGQFRHQPVLVGYFDIQ